MENQPTKLDKAVKISVIAGALLVALSVAYYLVVYIPKRDKTRMEQQQASDFDLQNKCSEQARKSFNDAGFGETISETTGYENHYNSKLKKCFIYTSTFNSKDNYIAKGLYDANENKTYAEYQEKITKTQPSDYTPYACSMLDKFCTTRAEFDNFVKLYMEE